MVGAFVLLRPDPCGGTNFESENFGYCIVVPEGYRIALTILGRDYEHDDAAATLSNMKHPMKGCGPFTHDDETDRPPAVFGGKVTVHFDQQPYVLLQVIPMN